MNKKILKTISCFVASIMSFTAVSSMIMPTFATEKINNVEETLNSLTLYEKICQMFITYQYTMPRASGTGKLTATETGTNLKNTLEKYPVGGILYDASSMQSHQQLTELVTKANSYSKIPLIVSVDEEGGRVARIGKTIGYTRGVLLEAMGSYSNQGKQKAFDNAQFLALNIKDHGFNLDFAPVADTNSNPQNTVIGTRAYSSDYNQAAELVGSAVLGFKSVGVGTTLKHFPGHGDTVNDTHIGAAATHKSLKTLRKEELKPFRAGIKSGTDAVMMAHITVDEIGIPSIFSKKITTNLLKDELGFNGIVVTDGLGMKAVTDYYTTEEVVLLGIESGIDVFLCIDNLPKAINTIEQAVLDGRISEERINESVRKILTFKKEHQ